MFEYMFITEDVPVQNFCASYLGSKCDPVAVLEDWNVDIDPNKPPVEEPTLPNVKCITLIKKVVLVTYFSQDGQPTQTILYLTDIHIDLSYTPGNLATECADEQCCFDSSGFVLT